MKNKDKMKRFINKKSPKNQFQKDEEEFDPNMIYSKSKIEQSENIQSKSNKMCSSRSLKSPFSKISLKRSTIQLNNNDEGQIVKPSENIKSKANKMSSSRSLKSPFSKSSSKMSIIQLTNDDDEEDQSENILSKSKKMSSSRSLKSPFSKRSTIQLTNDDEEETDTIICFTANDTLIMNNKNEMETSEIKQNLEIQKRNFEAEEKIESIENEYNIEYSASSKSFEKKKNVFPTRNKKSSKNVIRINSVDKDGNFINDKTEDDKRKSFFKRKFSSNRARIQYDDGVIPV